MKSKVLIALLLIPIVLSCNTNNTSEQRGSFEDRFMASLNKAIDSIKRTSNAGFDVEIAKLKKAIDGSKAMELIPYGGSILTINKNGKPFMQVMTFEDGFYSVNVYDQQAGEIATNITDKDGDGHLDDISYAVFHENGEELYRVLDMNWDGQPDMQTQSTGDESIRLWFNGAWHNTVRKGNRNGLIIDGTWTKVKHVNGKWIPANRSH